MKKALFVFLCLLTVASAQKKPFTIADLYRIRGIASPQVSPDGKRVVFTVSESMLAQGKTNSELYLVNLDGSGLRRLTVNTAADYSPAWMPDSKTILFISTRKEGPQVWRMSVDGGEPEQLTHVSTGIGNLLVSPTGAGFLFASDVYPEFGANDVMNKKTDEAREGGPIQVHMADHLLYRHWTSWSDGKHTHSLYYDLEKGSVVDLTPGEHDAPGFGMGDPTFSPDGAEVCFVSNRDEREAESTNKDLFLVPITGGPARNLTGTNSACDDNPLFSPGGTFIAYRMQTVPGYESDLFRLATIDKKTGARDILTEGKFDNWVTAIRWAPDGKSIFFLADVQGHVPLYRFDLMTRKINEVLNVKTIDAFEVAKDGRTIVYTRRSIGEPVELWKATLDNGVAVTIQQLTSFNKPLQDEIDIRPAEEMWIATPSGKRVHTFVVKPHDFDPKKKYPLILNVHGGPQSQWADAFRGDWQVYPGSGYIVAFPNPHGSTGYGQEFTAAISKDWGGKVYDDVMAVTDSLSHLPYVDADKMGAMGWSYVGYMMMWLEGHTTRFRAIVSMMGVYDLTAMHGGTEELWFPEWDLNGVPWQSDLYLKWSPNQYVKNFKTPCLVITGERDYRVPYTQSLEFFTDLQKMNVPSRLIVFPNDGHWPSGVKSMPLYYNAHLDWFHTYLGGGAAPYDMTKMIRNQAFE
jgi:dipeptidyl aminopeptidase/acylaminoacyl peptidase